MTWYKFWKKSGPNAFLDETYVWLDKEIYKTKDSIKGECEYWADRMPGGHNTHYSYGYKQVRHPPKSVLEKMIENTEENLKSKQEHIKFLKETLNKATKK
ncbi:hypothetical protein HZA97_00830 [Candidatus Woesearchaeota archaeon]|nr:hypothetical protein [Candidatus Woesearchaeota archaeon]